MQVLDKLMTPYHNKLQAVLEADKTGQYKNYLTDLETLGNEKDPKDQQELTANMKQSHYDFIKKTYSQVVVNHEEMRREITKVLGHSNFLLDEFGGITSNSFLPLAPLPQRFDVELTAPYDARQEQINIHLTEAHCISEGSPTEMAEIMLFAGGCCSSKGSVGDKFDLPAGSSATIFLTIIQWF